jgi:virginiamycin B lyase
MAVQVRGVTRPIARGVDAVTGAVSMTCAPLTHLYWDTAGDGTIYEAGLDGSHALPIITGQPYPKTMAIDSSHIYWADAGSMAAGVGTIMRANLDGTGVTTLVSGQNNPSGVAVNSSHIYWTDETTTGTVMAASLDGTGVTTLATGQNHPAGATVGP